MYESINQVPIVVRRELEGFILNRLQGALLAEAFRLVGEGYCSPQDLDKTIKGGLGLRWSFVGPFATIELNAPGGIADYCARYTGFYKRLQANPAGVEVYGDANVEKILAEWGEAGSPETARRAHALAGPKACGAGGAQEDAALVLSSWPRGPRWVMLGPAKGRGRCAGEWWFVCSRTAFGLR